jgi:hypothetical protein
MTIRDYSLSDARTWSPSAVRISWASCSAKDFGFGGRAGGLAGDEVIAPDWGWSARKFLYFLRIS